MEEKIFIFDASGKNGKGVARLAVRAGQNVWRTWNYVKSDNKLLPETQKRRASVRRIHVKRSLKASVWWFHDKKNLKYKKNRYKLATERNPFIREKLIPFCVRMRIDSCRKSSLTFPDEVPYYSKVQYSLHLWCCSSIFMKNKERFFQKWKV